MSLALAHPPAHWSMASCIETDLPKHAQTFHTVWSCHYSSVHFFGQKFPTSRPLRHRSLLASLSRMYQQHDAIQKEKTASQELPGLFGTEIGHFLGTRNYHEWHGGHYLNLQRKTFASHVFNKLGEVKITQTCIWSSVYVFCNRLPSIVVEYTPDKTVWTDPTKSPMKIHLLTHPPSIDRPVSIKWEENQRSLVFSGACREALWEGCIPSPVT